MRAFFLGYSDGAKKLAQPARDLARPILAQLARELTGREIPAVLGQIPWFHNVILVEKIKDPLERLWYAHQTVEHGWSRDILAHQIESGLYERQGQAVTNFKRTLPAPQSDLAHQAIKDPYTFDFLTLAGDARERELEKGLVDHIQRFLLELGVGFAFVGRQVHLEVEGDDFYIDLLFYHLRLRCYVVIELKNGPFKPEYAGKMNFYLSAVDDRLRHKDDNPSIGMILCRSRKKLIAEYALRDTHKPIGVSAYKLTKALPKKLKGTLPAIKDLEAELEG
jgi:predicted nuclease of restriction endonuclease-like (RecB) superfamily